MNRPAALRAPLTLRHDAAATGEPAARFIPGGDAAAWLDELLRWRVPLALLELFVVPTSAGDRAPAGVLVKLAGARPAETARSLPYRAVAGRLFVPVEAALSPPVTDAEWAELLPDGMAAFVWHPAVGLVGVEMGDVLRVSDLLAPPPVRAADWDRADPGLTFNESLHAVRAPDPPTVFAIFESGQDDIGTLAADLDDLDPKIGPAVKGAASSLGRFLLSPLRRLRDALHGRDAADPDTPPESRPQPETAGPGLGEHLRRLGQALGRAARGAARGALTPAAHLAREFARHAPETAARPTWVDGLEDWANRTLAAARDLVDARRRELRRLLDLLESDPDAGLRYALPVAGEGHRGIAPPSGALGERRIDFDLGRLGGGGPADFWDVPPDARADLVQHYRRLAEREVRLKRYRRAAYIYAQLLGEVNLAAGVLEQGGFLREAAVLYREKLGRPGDAARCLERAGLFEEAVELYEQLGLFEKVGDLYRQLERPDEAATAYRRAVKWHLGQHNPLKAAALLENRLDDPDEALAVLHGAWPASPQARQCLDESFRLTARLGRHELALESVRRLRTDPTPAPSVRPLVEGLVEAAATYPDGRVRAATADAARVVASRFLTEGHADKAPLLTAIARLAPQDRLLARDCRRYGTAASAAAVRRVTPTAPVGTRRKDWNGLECVGAIPLPADVLWRTVQSTRRGYYLLGWRRNKLVLVRGAWSGGVETQTTVTWSSPAFRGGAPLLMAVREGAAPAVAVMPVGGPPLPPRRLPATEAFPEEATAETPGWLEDGTLAVDSSTQSVACTVALDETGLSATMVGPGGELLMNSGGLPGHSFVPPEAHHDHRFAMPLHARPEGLYFGAAHALVSALPGWRTRVVEFTDFPGPIRSIVGSAPHTLTRLCVLHQHGGVVMWTGRESDVSHRLADDLVDPAACFLADGRLVVASAHSWHLYSTSGNQLRLLGSSARPPGLPPELTGPVALLPTAQADRIAVCSGQGPLTIFRIH